MKGNRNFFISRMLVLICVLVTTLAVFFMGFQLETTPSEDSQMDRWVGIATVCTAMASIVVGLITIWVMFDQQKMQDELIKYQKMEHRPNFIVRLTPHYGGDENANDSSFEELTIHNIGNQSYLINDIDINTYITCAFDDEREQFRYRIRFYDYFIKEGREANSDVIFKATSNREKRNLAKYLSMTDSVYNGKKMRFSKDIMVRIVYVDLYEETHIKYFRNGYPVDEKTYLEYSNFIVGHEASIDNFDVHTYHNQMLKNSSQS